MWLLVWVRSAGSGLSPSWCLIPLLPGVPTRVF